MLAMLWGCVLALAGCGAKPHRPVNSGVLDDTQQTRTALDQAYDMLARIDEFERGPAMTSIVSSLTNHLSQQKPLPDWEADRLVAQLPRSLRLSRPVEQLGRLEIVGSDATYLEEAILMRKLGAWVVQQKLPPDLSAWLEEQKADFSPDAAEDLGMAYLLFDWTVRNIQLDPLLPTPKDVAGPVGQAAGNIPPSLRGIPGPGYMAQPWHVAMTGHGDAWQRARVFIQLARQQDIDVVMLAATDAKEAGKTTPWACGVLLGDQLYLFDTQIGLPIPADDDRGIATLAQVRANGQLLRALDVDEDHRYEYTGEQLKSVHALIDASLESLSQRMRLLERDLAGERQLKLTIEPSELAARLRKAPGIANVMLWPVPIEANLFHLALLESPEFDPQLRQAIAIERWAIEQRTGEVSVSEARYKHLRGQFSSVPGEKGAKTLYVEARVPDEVIDSLDTNRALQEHWGLKGELERLSKPEQRLTFLEFVKRSKRQDKYACSYWLGLVHYETGNYESAVNWLDERTLKAAGENGWKPGAHYNLGRTYEQLNAPQLAQEHYLAVESAGEAGALVRAKRLADKNKNE